MKYALDQKLLASHVSVLADAEMRVPNLPSHYTDIIEKRLDRKRGDEYVTLQHAGNMEHLASAALESWQRYVAKEEGIDVDQVMLTNDADNRLYQTVAMQSRLPYHLREDPEYDDDDDPLELSFRVVSLRHGFT